MEDTAIDIGNTGAVDLTFVNNTAETTEKVHEDESATTGLCPEPGQLAELPRSLAEVTSVRAAGGVEHRLTLAPGATAAEVTAAMILMPPAAALAGHRSGAETVLVFHEPVRPPS